MSLERGATIYDICDGPILKPGGEPGEPGRVLAKIYRKMVHNAFLKYGVLKWCALPTLTRDQAAPHREMMASAMAATHDQWDDPRWIEDTFSPLAQLLDSVAEPSWRMRRPVAQEPGASPTPLDVDRVMDAAQADVFRVWDKTGDDPHFPVAAQVLLTGDKDMTGAGLMNILKGLGSVEYRNVTLLFALVRVFLLSNPAKAALLRKPFKGYAAPLTQSVSWIMHRTAFYDVIFFEQLYNRITKNRVDPMDRLRILGIMQSLIRYIVVTSREWLVSPARGIKHPAITCLPMDEDGNPLCSMKKRDWKVKRDLGFGDYVPDVDTTFLALTMAAKWLDLARDEAFAPDQELLEECEGFLDHPWVEIITEYQVGAGFDTNPPTITLTRPMDYHGSVPLWFDKPFDKNGRMVREALGNEICAGHNMDLLETILFNRQRWNSLEGENLETVRRFLDFHYRLFRDGGFRLEGAVRFYLPSIYVNYAGRLYETFKTLSAEERALVDPEGKMSLIREKAIEYFTHDMLSFTANPFDAALALSGLALLDAPRQCAPMMARGVKVLADTMGEGPGRHPYKAYEWTMVRHPTRVIVGSPVATSLFVLNAMAEVRAWMDVQQGGGASLA